MHEPRIERGNMPTAPADGQDDATPRSAESGTIRTMKTAQERDVSNDDTVAVTSIGLLRLVLGHIMLMLVIPLATATATLLWWTLFPTYTSTATLVPQVQTSALSTIAGLAAQFGVQVGANRPTTTVDFYSDLVTSRELLSQVVSTRYHFTTGGNPTDTLSGTLVEIYSIHRDTPEETLLRTIQELEDHLRVSQDLKTSIITVQVSARWPNLAEQINDRILEELNRFNLQQRQSQASAERRFTEERLAAARSELEEAEDSMKTFLVRNRRIQDSPQLLFEQARLQRQIDLRQQVYTTLAQALEQARIEEVRNTPVVTIIDHPQGSAERALSPIVLVSVALLVSMALTAIGLLAREYLTEQRRRHPKEFAEVNAILKSIGARIRVRRQARVS